MNDSIVVISNNNNIIKNFKYFTRHFNYDLFTYQNILQININIIQNSIIIIEYNNLNEVNVLKQMRASLVICIFNTYNQKKIINAYEKGMDEYYVIPFSYVELFYKLKAINKRNANYSFITFNDLKINTFTKQVLVNNKQIELNNKEYLLIYYLLINKEGYVTREFMLKHIWKRKTNTRSIDTNICSLRKKLKNSNVNIVCKRNYGYHLKNK